MTTSTEIPSTNILQNIQQATESVPLVGSMTWYGIPPCEITHPELEAAFATAGLPHDWLPKKVTNKNAYLKACRVIEELARETVKNSPGIDYLLRKADDSKEQCVMVLLREVRIPNERDVEHTTVAKLILDKEAEDVVFRVTPEANEAINKIHENNSFRGLHSRFRDRLTERELRPMVVSIIDDELFGVTVRDKGGVYFVPRGKHHYLKSLHEAVARVAGGEVCICPVPDIKEARATLYKAMAEEMQKELRYLVRDIEEASKDEEKGTSMRPKTLANHLLELKHLRAKASSYAELMHFTADNLHEEIAKVEAKVRTLL